MDVRVARMRASVVSAAGQPGTSWSACRESAMSGWASLSQQVVPGHDFLQGGRSPGGPPGAGPRRRQTGPACRLFSWCPSYAAGKRKARGASWHFRRSGRAGVSLGGRFPDRFRGIKENGKKRKRLSRQKRCILDVMFRYVSPVFPFPALRSMLPDRECAGPDHSRPFPSGLRTKAGEAREAGWRHAHRVPKDVGFNVEARLLQQFYQAEQDCPWRGVGERGPVE